MHSSGRTTYKESGPNRSTVKGAVKGILNERMSGAMQAVTSFLQYVEKPNFSGLPHVLENKEDS